MFRISAKVDSPFGSTSSLFLLLRKEETQGQTRQPDSERRERDPYHRLRLPLRPFLGEEREDRRKWRSVYVALYGTWKPSPSSISPFQERDAGTDGSMISQTDSESLLNRPILRLSLRDEGRTRGMSKRGKQRPTGRRSIPLERDVSHSSGPAVYRSVYIPLVPPSREGGDAGANAAARIQRGENVTFEPLTALTSSPWRRKRG